jgi:ribosomal protein L22
MAEKKPVTRKKAVKPAKVEEKPAAPAKPKVTEARAVAYDVRLTPRKARMVIDLVRGKDQRRPRHSSLTSIVSASPAVPKSSKAPPRIHQQLRYGRKQTLHSHHLR